MAILIVVLCGVMEGVNQERALGADNVGLFEVRGYSEGATCTALAIRAVANPVDRRLAVNRDPCETTSALGCSWHGQQREWGCVRPNE